ncbi:sugar nucleotide-binding protein, partial [Rhodobacteraceae bacterium R_SAG10]|nr:sugar nucleotide-binding protein [Rhodobacteraceae bacterium R_SAG10]
MITGYSRVPEPPARMIPLRFVTARPFRSPFYASALLRMADRMSDGAEGGMYHFAGTPNISWAGFARAIFEQAGLSVDVQDIASSQYRTPARRPANSRL